MSIVSMKQLLEAGVHFGHQSKKWNPKMKKYIFTARNNIHIINLEETSLQIDKAYAFVRDVVAQGKSVLFVGTKKQAQDSVKEEAERCGMFYVNNRWLGGTLTNFKTIRSRIERLNKLIQMEKVGEMDFLPKKEVLKLKAEQEKLEKNLNGIKEMREFPGVIFLVDPMKEHICIREAISLKIPVVAIVDTNGDPSGIEYVIPANDDALRSVKLITSAIADAVIEAKEGISLKEPLEEEVDIKSALAEALSTMEIADKKVEDDEDKIKLKKKTFKKAELKTTDEINTETEKFTIEDKKLIKKEADIKEAKQEKSVNATEQTLKTEKVKEVKEEPEIDKVKTKKVEVKSEKTEIKPKKIETKTKRVEVKSEKTEIKPKKVEAKTEKVETKTKKVETKTKNIENKTEKVETKIKIDDKSKKNLENKGEK